VSRTVFAGMLTFVESGCTAQELASSIDVALSDAHDGLETLVALNLVDCCGGLHDKRFSIHNLTRQFLQHQVARWQ
jgi:DNA-binding IclR family transcriptional regulator